MLYVLNFDNNTYCQNCEERVGPVRVRRSKYSLLLLYKVALMWEQGEGPTESYSHGYTQAPLLLLLMKCCLVSSDVS